MELRLVDRTLSRELSFPIPNDARRVKGFGILEKDRRIVLHDDEGKKHIMARADEILSNPKEGTGLCFLIIIDNTNHSFTTAWSEKEFKAFIVNDEGKTIDKIVS